MNAEFDTMVDSSLPKVTIVVPTFKRKEKLARLLMSIRGLNYPKELIETIVIVDADEEKYDEIVTTYNEVQFHFNDVELFISKTRNSGADLANGELIFFVDDDNVLDADSVKILTKEIQGDTSIGIVAPIMLFLSRPDTIWCAGATVQKITMAHKHIGDKCKLDNFDPKISIESHYVPNSYMVRKKDFDRIGGFDGEMFPIAMEEVDLAIRFRNEGFKVKVIPSAKTWHDIPFQDDVHVGGRRAFFRGRSRILFYNKYAKWRVLLLPVDFISYMTTALRFSTDQVSDAIFYIKGILSGIIFSMKK